METMAKIMRDESVTSRGSKEFSSCLFKYLPELQLSLRDSCVVQNKNTYVADVYMIALQNHRNLDLIDHKFLISSYRYMGGDWIQLVRMITRRKIKICRFLQSIHITFALRKHALLPQKDKVKYLVIHLYRLLSSTKYI